MKSLIIGYGSIGKRHSAVLAALNPNATQHIVTKQTLDTHTTFKSLDDITDWSYDYVVIASETHLHHAQLRQVNRALAGGKILVEKPLFSTDDSFEDDLIASFEAFIVWHPFRLINTGSAMSSGMLLIQEYSGHHFFNT